MLRVSKLRCNKSLICGALVHRKSIGISFLEYPCLDLKCKWLDEMPFTSYAGNYDQIKSNNLTINFKDRYRDRTPGYELTCILLDLPEIYKTRYLTITTVDLLFTLKTVEDMAIEPIMSMTLEDYYSSPKNDLPGDEMIYLSRRLVLRFHDRLLAK